MGSEKFTQKAECALNNSLEIAERMGSLYIGTEHFLLSLIETTGSIANKILNDCGVTRSVVLEALQDLPHPAKRSKLTVKNITPKARCILDNAHKCADKYGAPRIGTEHILLALLEEKETLASKLLNEIGIDISAIKDKTRQKIKEYEKVFGKIEDFEKRGRVELPVLLKYGKLLSDPTVGKCWDIVGRENIIDRLIRTLSRKTKNNPILLGEAGVGKTAIVEGLAHRIISKNVPSSMRGTILVSLDLTKIVAGTKYRGDFEERIRQILDEAKKHPQVVLFIDEIHTVIGAGAAEGAVDLANIIKPELSRAEIRVIGATTHDEYRRTIEKDSALERRFQPIFVEEPSIEESNLIIRSVVSSLEKHHKVIIDESAISSSVELSDRYLVLRKRPDKCIDLLDEACAYTALHKRCNTDGIPTVTRKELHCVLEELDGTKKIQHEFFATLDGLTQELSKFCIGQIEACRAVAQGILRAGAGVQDPKRPLGCYFFYGATGVGKTRMALALARALFDDEERCIHLDMSEYSEAHSISKLIGAPQGYVGYGDGGILTQAVRKQPYSVILFDEIEKAHRDIYHLLLQVMEDGRLTDSDGRVVSFRNTFIVFTSNISQEKGSAILGFMDDERTSNDASDDLKGKFPPEFVSRIDSFVKFGKLNREDLFKICENELSEFTLRLKRENIILCTDASLYEFLLDNANTKNLGARSIRTQIRMMLESKVAEYILNHKASREIYAFAADGEILVSDGVLVGVK